MKWAIRGDVFRLWKTMLCKMLLQVTSLCFCWLSIGFRISTTLQHSNLMLRLPECILASLYINTEQLFPMDRIKNMFTVFAIYFNCRLKVVNQMFVIARGPWKAIIKIIISYRFEDDVEHFGFDCDVHEKHVSSSSTFRFVFYFLALGIPLDGCSRTKNSKIWVGSRTVCWWTPPHRFASLYLRLFHFLFSLV